MAEGASGTPIDSISIEIGASAGDAAKEIKKLSRAMDDLKSSVSGIKIGGFKKELGELGNTEVSKIEKLAKALSGLKGVSLNSKLGKTMLDIAEAAEMVEPKQIDSLVKFGNALKNMQGTKTSIGDKLPAQLLNVAAAVDSITDDTITRVHRLTLALGRLKGVDLSGIGQVLKAQNNAWKMEHKTATKKAEQQTVTEAKQSGTTPKTSTESVTITKKKQPMLSYEKASSIANQNVSGQVLYYMKATGKVLRSNLVPMATAFTKGLSKAASSAKNLLKHVASIAKAKIKNLIDKSAIGSLEQSFKRIQKIVRSFGRIAFYRAIRSAIRYITDSLKEGTENAYHYAREFGDATSYIADAYDRISSSNFKMSNQLGAAWSTLIATIEPIIIKIIQLVTKAADAVTRLFAILGGKSTYLKAVDYNKKWADSATGAAKAAEEWKNQLMGFDEINRLEEPSDSNGGGAGGLDDYGNMFEEAPVDEGLFKQIRDMINAGEWSELGELLGNKVNELVDSIDFKKFGKKLGEGISNGIDLAYSFLKTVNFKNIGEKIAEFLNNAAYQINFTKLGQLSMRIRTALWDVIYGAIVGINWKMVAIKLSDYLIGALTELADWLETLDPKEIAGALKDFFGNIKYEEIKDALSEVFKNAFGLLGEIVRELLPEDLGEDVTEGIANIVKNADFAAIHNVLSYKLDEAVFGPKWAKLWWGHGDYAGKEIINGLIEGTESKQDELKRQMEEVAQDTIDVTERMLDIGSPSRVFADIGKNIVAGLIEGVNVKWNEFTGWMEGKWNTFKSWWQGLSTGTFRVNLPKLVVDWEPLGDNSIIRTLFGFTAIPHLRIGWETFAKGGFPQEGSLFLANEYGPELVGTMGGRNAVANQEEITEGIARATYEAFMMAFSQTGGSKGNDQPVNIYLDGKLIAKSTTKYQNQYARVAGI